VLGAALAPRGHSEASAALRHGSAGPLSPRAGGHRQRLELLRTEDFHGMLPSNDESLVISDHLRNIIHKLMDDYEENDNDDTGDTDDDDDDDDDSEEDDLPNLPGNGWAQLLLHAV